MSATALNDFLGIELHQRSRKPRRAGITMVIDIGYNPAMVAPGSLVTVVVGNGTTMTPAPVAPVTTSTSKSATTTTVPGTTTTTTVPDPAGIKSSPLFGVPTATNMPLAPYDPRACNAAGTGPAA